MFHRKRVFAVITLLVFFFGLGLLSDANAKRSKRVAQDPDAPTNEEAKVLGWGPVKAPNRAKNPEFLMRGVVLEIQSVPKKKDWYTVNILPIEVLNNHQRVITFDHFRDGYAVNLLIPPSKKKELKKGHMVEYNQYYTEEVEQSIGGAKMIAMTLHKEIQGYPAGPGAYLKNQGFYPIQYMNALKGAQFDKGSIPSDNDIKANIDILATSSKDPELKTAARAFYEALYNSSPTGKCKYVKSTGTYNCI